ncbi:Nif3-like dinuclear metal center hexameric protein [Glycomyces buryatensis]|uniref:GTP cyclohydrolase 1 type 2 homolog n=1 Tax=Glycomyces buryatensis TaxID=2570927 RepID=A0A4S8QDM0_9ACTN|nr:Nif3-like dinuclear metal center hexameric protein [Glycomyces buryatensis]THV38604.1 Nif3-like dinuclear metal center hexameric protein [Glycomyces buryatensis]
MRTLREVIAALDEIYPRHWAEDWDRVGLICGRADYSVRKILCVVDVVPETVIEANELGCDLIVAHHPLLLRGVSSLDPVADYKGDLVHTLIENGIGLYVAHTNADIANPGVSDALADRLGLIDLRPLRPSSDPEHHAAGRGIGRVGRLPEPLTLSDLVARVAKALPPTAWGVRGAGRADALVSVVAVCGGAGDTYLADATATGAGAYLTADLRHHPASEHLARSGPALIDAAHWATERPWLDTVAEQLSELADEVFVSDLDTDPWTIHQNSGVNRVES